MKYRQRLLIVVAVVLVLLVWTIFIHNPGFRKHERHESIRLADSNNEQDLKEEHPTLKIAISDDVLPLKEEFHRPDSKPQVNIIQVGAGAVHKKSTHKSDMDYEKIWDMWNHWPTSNSILPKGKFWSRNMSDLLTAMATADIESFDVGIRGTQLKVSVILEGGQLAVFKPKRYEPEHIIKGDPISGFDRHDAEIAAFHLDGLVNQACN